MIKNKIEDLLEQIMATSRYKVGDVVYCRVPKYIDSIRVVKAVEVTITEIILDSYAKRLRYGVKYSVALETYAYFWSESDLFNCKSSCEEACVVDNDEQATNKIQSNKVRISELKTENLKLEKYLTY